MIRIIWLDGEPRRPTVPRHPAPSSGYPYSMWWDRHERRHQRCRIFARGTKNSVGIEFEDGFRTVISRNALRVAR